MVADPRLVDPAGNYTVELDAANSYLLTSGRQPKEFARMRPFAVQRVTTLSSPASWSSTVTSRSGKASR